MRQKLNTRNTPSEDILSLWLFGQKGQVIRTSRRFRHGSKTANGSSSSAEWTRLKSVLTKPTTAKTPSATGLLT